MGQAQTNWLQQLSNLEGRNARMTTVPAFTHLPNYPITNSLRDTHLRGNALGHKSFNHIALLYVIEVLEIDTALHAIADFAGIVFKALERTDFPFEYLNAIAHQTDIGVAFDGSVQHITAGDGACLGYAERLA